MEVEVAFFNASLDEWGGVQTFADMPLELYLELFRGGTAVVSCARRVS